MSHLNKSDYTIGVVEQHRDALELIKKYHYAHGGPNTSVYRHGLYHNIIGLVGVALWLPPTKLAAMTVNPNWERVISLSRLVVLPSQPTNAASFLIGGSIRIIKQDGRFDTLLTYADARMGHTGAIYRATNWAYLGLTKPQPVWLDPSGKQVARKATKTRTNAQMLELGYVRSDNSQKHKFVMRLR